MESFEDDDEFSYISDSMGDGIGGSSFQSSYQPHEPKRPAVDLAKQRGQNIKEPCYLCKYPVNDAQEFVQFRCGHRLHFPLCHMDCSVKFCNNCPTCSLEKWKREGRHNIDPLLCGFTQLGCDLLQHSSLSVSTHKTYPEAVMGFPIVRSAHVIERISDSSMLQDKNGHDPSSSTSLSSSLSQLKETEMRMISVDETVTDASEILQMNSRESKVPVNYRLYSKGDIGKALSYFSKLHNTDPPQTVGIGFVNAQQEAIMTTIRSIFQQSTPEQLVNSLKSSKITFKVLKRNINFVYPSEKGDKETLLDRLLTNCDGINLTVLVDIGAKWSELVQIGLQWKHVKRRPKFLKRMAAVPDNPLTITRLLKDLCGLDKDPVAAYDELLLKNKTDVSVLEALKFSFEEMIIIHKYTKLEAMKYIPLGDLVNKLGLNERVLNLLPDSTGFSFFFMNDVMKWPPQDLEKYLGIQFIVPTGVNSSLERPILVKNVHGN